MSISIVTGDGKRSSERAEAFGDRLASRTAGMKASVLREILKVASQPGVISLAGGLPAPESFPVDFMPELIAKVLKKYGPAVFQYGPTEGFPPFREILAGYLAERGVKATADEVIVTTGSQQMLDTLGKVLISPGDKVAVESPTYLGALAAFNPYQPNYVAIDSDDDGVIPESLEEILAAGSVKFVYLIPNFQNPSGRTIPADRRKAIAKSVIRYNALLIEDDPYRALRYEGNHLPTIWSMAPDNVVHAGTMSKVLSPGLRLGFSVAPALIRRWMVLAKQGIDLHTSSFDQALAAEYIAEGYLERHLPRIVDLYRPRLRAMLDSLEEFFPDSFSWSKPQGGMFVWATGPEGLDTDKLYAKAIERKVAYVPGQYFFSSPGVGKNTMRLNFSNVGEEAIKTGIKTLAWLMAEASS
ncbi:MAG: PLP-dependent aminotransferase family protein [Candidatus Zixiibacteriota bacterium]|nr:MAG: PLP-dependent aminotransferase family protein [candidate division Zixibacteria bacterium]